MTERQYWKGMMVEADEKITGLVGALLAGEPTLDRSLDMYEGTAGWDGTCIHRTQQSIVIMEEEEFSFYFDDGDLFRGHAIVVSGSLAQGATDADIAG